MNAMAHGQLGLRMREQRSSGADLERALTRYGFSLAIAGLIVGFVGVHYGSRWLHVVGAGLVAVGVLLGWASVFLGIARFPAELRRSLRAAPWRSMLTERVPDGRTWTIRMVCFVGFTAALGFGLALVVAWIPPIRDLMRQIGWTPDFGTGFVLFGTAVALAGYWRMRRWGVWLLGAVLTTAPFVLVLTGSHVVAWANLLGVLFFLVIGVRHYQQMT